MLRRRWWEASRKGGMKTVLSRARYPRSRWCRPGWTGRRTIKHRTVRSARVGRACGTPSREPEPEPGARRCPREKQPLAIIRPLRWLCHQLYLLSLWRLLFISPSMSREYAILLARHHKDFDSSGCSAMDPVSTTVTHTKGSPTTFFSRKMIKCSPFHPKLAKH